MDKTKFFRHKILPIYWAFLTFVLLKPSEKNREEMWFEFPHLDKLVHIGGFTVLGYCYAMAFPKHRFWVMMSIIVVYAIITEALQGAMDMGRTMDYQDFLADMLGVVLGYVFWQKTDFFNSK